MHRGSKGSGLSTKLKLFHDEGLSEPLSNEMFYVHNTIVIPEVEAFLIHAFETTGFHSATVRTTSELDKWGSEIVR